MEYSWMQTEPVVYRSVYNRHKDDFVVFETYTEMDSRGGKLVAQITAWGFKDAEHPLIRSELKRDGEWIYSILGKAYVDEYGD